MGDAHPMLGNRMSSLPLARYCSQAPRLGSVASGRAAAQSTAAHALWAGDPSAADKLALLTDEEREELEQWTKPADVVVGERLLRYADAQKELTVALDWAGSYIEPGNPRALTVGHVDFVWIVDFSNGTRVAYVGDLKRSEWTTVDGPDSLQLIAYGLAVASKELCDAFVCGIWSLIDGRWEWGDMIELDSPRADELRKRVVAAARNTVPEFNMGAHCLACYGRKRCPAYLLPPEVAETSLSPFAEGGAEITGESALRALLLAKRATDTAKVVEDACKAFVKQGGKIVDPETGKVFKPIPCQGRETIDKDALIEAGITIPMKRGKGYDRFQWGKP